MKRSKRILSILLSTALLATAVITAFPAHAETTPSDFTAAFQNRLSAGGFQKQRMRIRLGRKFDSSRMLDLAILR